MNMVYKTGDIRYGTEVLAPENRKKILLLSDDLRMGSGVGTVSRNFVMGTLHRFKWFQLGAAVKHPERGKIMDLSEDAASRYGIENPSVRVLPWDGYGNMELLRQLINMENPDAILHFTDPRYWQWLYDGEHEIRQSVPIGFHAIWDNLPTPAYNRDYYESCDWVGAISRQTYGIVKRLSRMDDKSTWQPRKEWQTTYVPHGINSEVYFPTDVPTDFKDELFGSKEYDFVLFWSNRNIRRKQPSDVILAFKQFCDKLPKEKADKCVLVMHTQPKDQNGTDLYAVKEAVAPDCNIVFSTKRRDEDGLNYLYNIADCTINIAGNEGFGLTTAESVMAGTPMITAVTGGLQDQCGFRKKDTGELFTPDEYIEIGSLHKRKEWMDNVTWGEWVFPVWPRIHTLVGSVSTPYIWDDKVDTNEVADAIKSAYDVGRDELKRRGSVGREAFLGEMGLSHENMCKQLNDGLELMIENWTPRKKYEIFKLK